MHGGCSGGRQVTSAASPVPIALQAGVAYGVMEEDVDRGVSTWWLISSATLAEAMYQAADKSPSNVQVMASLSSPLKVHRPGTQSLGLRRRACAGSAFEAAILALSAFLSWTEAGGRDSRSRNAGVPWSS